MYSLAPMAATVSVCVHADFIGGRSFPGQSREQNLSPWDPRIHNVLDEKEL